MLNTSLLNRPCTIVQRTESGATDAYGNDIPTEVRTDTVCELQQQRRTEPNDAGELSDTLWLVVLPADTSVDTGDAVETDDGTYELVGDPWNVRNPWTGVFEHVEATARRTAGEQGS